MVPISTIDTVGLVLTVGLMVLYSIKSHTVNTGSGIQNRKSLFLSLALGILFIILFGLRDYQSSSSGDSSMYAYFYQNVDFGTLSSMPWKGEWLWSTLIVICRLCGCSVSDWFTIVAVIYIIPVVIGCYRISKSAPFTLFLSFIGCFVFYTNGINGIRNADACSIAFLAMTYMMTRQSRMDVIIAIALSYIAISIHASAIMLVAPLFVSCYLVKNVRMALLIWGLSIIVSLAVGSSLAHLIAGFSEDERAMAYLTAGDNAGQMAKFSSSGFRFDFLLYSALPIMIGFHVISQSKIADRKFSILLNTYLLSNALWIIFINAAYSNRFAMLSWFIYPFVLAYPFTDEVHLGGKRLMNIKCVLWIQYGVTLILRYI